MNNNCFKSHKLSLLTQNMRNIFCTAGTLVIVNSMSISPANAMLCLSEAGGERSCASSSNINNLHTNSVYLSPEYQIPTTSASQHTSTNSLSADELLLDKQPESVEATIKAYQQKEFQTNTVSANSSIQLTPTTKTVPNVIYIDKSNAKSSNNNPAYGNGYTSKPVQYYQPKKPVATPRYGKPFVPNLYGNSSSTNLNYFDQARQAAARGDIDALYEYEQNLSGSLFAMYPAYWRLDKNLNNLSAQAIIGFAKRYPNSVMAEKLVADYAEEKARSGDYRAVQQVARYIQNADKSEACAIGIGDVHANNRTRLETAKEKAWLTTKKQPALCDQLAMELNNSSYITAKDRQNRLYRMLRMGNTGQIMALSSRVGSMIGYSDLQRVQLDTNGFFSRFAFEPYNQKNQYLYLYAIAKMADKSYSQAIGQLEYDIRQDNQRGQKLLTAQTRRMAYRTIAVKRMNMNTDDGFSKQSVLWFRNSLGEPFNFEEAEDYALAAIRFNEWADVTKAISSMSQKKQQEDVWQYWLARAYEQTGNARQAKKIFKNLAKTNQYYGFLAKDKIRKRTSINNISNIGGAGLANISQVQRTKMLQNPSFARAFALYSVNRNYAKREWNWGVFQAIKNNDTELLLAAARHAHDLGWYDRSIYAMEKANEDLGVLNAGISHPMPHQGSVVNYSYQAGIDPAWAYGIMRQESRFNVGARSHVGAGGLMQIMPSTGKYIARNLGESYNSRRINSGDTNIRYGTWYMGDILHELGDQPVLATAGYNAGPSKARAWQPYYGSLEADQYVESIAYPETKNYVKRVMENATIYGHRLGRGQNISQRMGTIYPK